MAGIDGSMVEKGPSTDAGHSKVVTEVVEPSERKRKRRPIDPFDLGRVPIYNDERRFSISPSSWNNFVACPRRFWLSRRRLPRKAGMAASVGTIVHGALEDVLLLDVEDKEDGETGWMPVVLERLLDNQWEDEKKRFFAHQRQPKWKEESREKATQLLNGSMDIVLKRSGVGLMSLDDVSVGFWKWVQSLMGAVEGELRTSDGKIMGRLDVMMYDIDTSGEVVGWIVADLKTGRPPTDGVYDTVSRQLRLYRDLLSEN
ncbi:MAG TPA: PD-(D/E)XK nuclease family protein, partial [Candidatus Poseidoniales archaeon]|nr:PD-(D/E)XK nuclease family protein [Candidatus Poseidoniales archaeon]